MNTVSEQINALIAFKRAYNQLLFHWDGKPYREADGINLNDTKAIDLYPFHRSFDELDVVDWCMRTVEELKKHVVPRDEPGLDKKDVDKLERIIYNLKEEIGFLSVEDVEHLEQTLKNLAYVKAIKAFHKHLLDSMPNLPNDTPEDTYDLAWQKFYETPFTISFGDKTVTIQNEATIWQGIVDALEEMIDYCL